MNKAIGIINLPKHSSKIDGLTDHRPLCSTSFLGRYRIIDFQISNLTNSGISNIHVHLNKYSKSLIEHLGNGRQYNINEKKGKLSFYFLVDNSRGSLYKQDINTLISSVNDIKNSKEKYVVLTSGSIIASIDYSYLLSEHIASNSDVSICYYNSKTTEVNKKNDMLCINDKKLEYIGDNPTETTSLVSMETYIISKDKFIDLLESYESNTGINWFSELINSKLNELNINCIEYKDYISIISSIKDYHNANSMLLNINNRRKLFKDNWEIYTKTLDTNPVHYSNDSHIENSLVSNGAIIHGKVVNSVIGRDVLIEKGAIVENSIVLANSKISNNAYIKNAVIDKHSRITENKQVISEKEILYVKRDDYI